VFSFLSGKSDNTAAWFNASLQLGCSGSDAKESLVCMRKKSYQEILAASYDPNPLSAILGDFGPTPDNKVVFTQNQYKLRQLAGEFIKKPYLTGSNHYEAGLFRLFAQATNVTIPDIDWCLFDLAVFTCPAARSALGRALALVPSYRYRYYGQFANLRLTKTPNSGAWHGSEIPLIWGTVQESTLLANSAIESEIGKYLQTTWASFAKNPLLAFKKLPHTFPIFNELSRLDTG
jgi:cholinesterase